jgi:hypothetical protein
MKRFTTLALVVLIALGCAACHGGRFGFRPHGLVTIGRR